MTYFENTSLYLTMLDDFTNFDAIRRWVWPLHHSVSCIYPKSPSRSASLVSVTKYMQCLDRFFRTHGISRNRHSGQS